jgi:hypothetical protein
MGAFSEVREDISGPQSSCFGNLVDVCFRGSGVSARNVAPNWITSILRNCWRTCERCAQQCFSCPTAAVPRGLHCGTAGSGNCLTAKDGHRRGVSFAKLETDRADGVVRTFPRSVESSRRQSAVLRRRNCVTTWSNDVRRCCRSACGSCRSAVSHRLSNSIRSPGRWMGPLTDSQVVLCRPDQHNPG